MANTGAGAVDNDDCDTFGDAAGGIDHVGGCVADIPPRRWAGMMTGYSDDDGTGYIRDALPRSAIDHRQ